jgi:hypothetical protein
METKQQLTKRMDYGNIEIIIFYEKLKQKDFRLISWDLVSSLASPVKAMPNRTLGLRPIMCSTVKMDTSGTKFWTRAIMKGYYFFQIFFD